MLNGYTSFLLTKLDILSDIPELKIRLENNEYKKFDGWSGDISKCRKFDDLPVNA